MSEKTPITTIKNPTGWPLKLLTVMNEDNTASQILAVDPALEDLTAAAVDALEEFRKTADGQKAFFKQYNTDIADTELYWCDLIDFVPNEICQKHGFVILGRGIDQVRVDGGYFIT